MKKLIAVLFAVQTCAATADVLSCYASLRTSLVDPLTIDLPQPDSQRFHAIVEDVKIQLAGSRAYADIDLSDIFTETLAKAWMNELADRPPLGFLAPSAVVAEQVEKIHRWFEILLEHVVGDRYKFCSMGKPESRVSRTRDMAISVGGWHIDQCLASFLLPVFGPGPEMLGPAPIFENPGTYTRSFTSQEWFEMCPGCQPRVLPRGHLALFLGTEVGNLPTLRQGIHRSPAAFDERYLIVSRFTQIANP